MKRCTYIFFLTSYSPKKKKKILLEHVSMHMIKRKCNMYMEAIKQSEDKGIMMGTTITIKLKGQSVIFFFSSSSTILRFLAFY